MTTKRRKRSINQTEEATLSSMSIEQSMGADIPTESDSEHSSSSQHSGDGSQQGLLVLFC